MTEELNVISGDKHEVLVPSPSESHVKGVDDSVPVNGGPGDDGQETNAIPIESVANEGHPIAREWGFELDQLFQLSQKFYKDNEGKAFHPSYDNRNKLVALIMQAKYGCYTGDKAKPAGALDIVGKDRRQAWSDLGSQSKEDAIISYVSLINDMCPLFKPYMEAHKREKEERERLLLEQQVRQRREEEAAQFERNRVEEEVKRQENHEIQQKSAIQDALNRQTYSQFAAYAQQQYPADRQQQEILIKQLQAQHYEQYMQQMVQHQGQARGQPGTLVQVTSNGVNRTSSSSDAQNAELLANESSPLQNQSHPSYSTTSDVQRQAEQERVAQLVAANGNGNGQGGESEEEGEEAEEGSFVAAQMWTRKEIDLFKDAIKKEGGEGVIKVGHGEIVTVRVPTHPDGSCIFWEFATDSHDIGFGLLFEWTKNPGNQVSVHVSESEDEDDEEGEESGQEVGGDPEKGHAGGHIVTTGLAQSNGMSLKGDQDSGVPTSVIIPIYRRDSNEEVFAGSHSYPGSGVYLLKFDNSYSLWRSKNLYYRVYYTR